MTNDRHWYGRTRLMSKTNLKRALERLVGEVHQLEQAMVLGRHPAVIKNCLQDAKANLQVAYNLTLRWPGAQKK